MIHLMVYFVVSQYKVQTKLQLHIQSNSRLVLKRREKKRITWCEVNKRISHVHFRRMFRMTRDYFDLLCQKNIAAIDESMFRSEVYISAFFRGRDKMYDDNTLNNGRYISREEKLTITLRLLGGGDALELGVIFDVHSDHCARLMYEVLLQWIIHPNIGNLGMIKCFLDEQAMVEFSKGFSDRSGGLLKRVIGVLDG